MSRIREVCDPDRTTVASAARCERPEVPLVVAARRPAGPDVMTVLDATRSVAGRQLDEVTDLREVRWIGVRDDVETGAAARVARGAGAGTARLVDVDVPRVERADDQLAPHVEVHVLVLPVAVRTEDLRRLERVEQLRRLRVADVVGLEAVAAGRDQDLSIADRVELALHDLSRVRDAADVVQRGGDLRAGRRRERRGAGARADGSHERGGEQQTHASQDHRLAR